MSDTYGIWTESDGGFTCVGMTLTEAERLLECLIEEDAANADDLFVVECCADHEDHPHGSCPECDHDNEHEEGDEDD